MIFKVKPANVAPDDQVLLPKALMEHLGLGVGGNVDIQTVADGRIVIQKVRGEPLPPSRFGELRGHAGPGLSTDEIMLLLRGEPE